MKKRIVVTGIGLVSCFGNDPETFFASLLEGKSGVRPITKFDVTDYPTQFAAFLDDVDLEGLVDYKLARRMDPFIHYGMVAGKKAYQMAGLDAVDKDRAGILIGSGMGGLQSFYDTSLLLKEFGYKKVSPFYIPSIITNMVGGLLGIDLGFTGPNYSVSTACATGNYAIVNAAEHIRKGDADVMLCGGAEAGVTQLSLAAFITCKALSRRNDDPQGASRPWDRDRDGFVMGEGAGVLVLESLEHAKKRNAPILAEYFGGALNCDAYHMTNPKPDGSGGAACIQKAIEDAGVSIEDINYVNAHGTSTPAGDGPEILGLRKVLGDHITNVAINSTKSMIGHALGAASGLEAVAVIQSILKKKVHPTINLDNVDEPFKDLNLVAHQPQDLDVNLALSNSFGFGGHNSCVILGAYRE